MGKALYRKYRSKSLDEVAGQEHITSTLKNALKQGKISHAYLLTGPKGVGKTSVARILAHAINDIPYDDEKTHLDIIEIDAASNRRIDEIRDLRDKVHILPSSGKYKVYIIDEVHMLTREAFNALLKTLEEPPAHVVFILATTEAHKLPETIVSRTQHFSFKPIDTETLVSHLRQIASSEDIEIDDGAISLIAEHGDGSFRDSISLLDQVSALDKHVTLPHVQQLLGLAPREFIDRLLGYLQTGDVAAVVLDLEELRLRGIPAQQVAKQLSVEIRRQMLGDPSFQRQETSNFLKALLEIPTSLQPERTLELVLLDYIFSQTPHLTNTAVSTSAPSVTVEPPAKVEKKVEKTEATPAKKTEVKEEKAVQPKPESTDPFTVESWPVVLSSLKSNHNTLYGILRMAEPSLDGSVLTLSFRFAFHKKQLSEKKNETILSDTIKKLGGEGITINSVLASEPKKADKPKSPTPKANPTPLDTVSDIFGGAEVLES